MDIERDATKKKLEEAAAFFASARPSASLKRTKIEEYNKQIQKENVSYSMDLMDKMLIELSAMTTEMKEHIPTSSQLVDRYNRLIQEYGVNLPKTKEWSDIVSPDNVEDMQKCVTLLKSHCDTVVSVIEDTFDAHYSALLENNDEVLSDEIEHNLNTKTSEKELLISRYKTMFYECIVFFENNITEARKKQPRL
mgnify:CR=1 FL=1